MIIELDQTRIMIIYCSFMIIKWKYLDDHITYMRLNDCFSLFRKPKSYAHSNYSTGKEIVGQKIVLHERGCFQLYQEQRRIQRKNYVYMVSTLYS